MSWVRIWIHLVFSTKNREPCMNIATRKEVFKHIKENAIAKGIGADTVNGYSDHAHCLILLNKSHSISDVSMLIKGESSHWINTNKMIAGRFSWQDDYWAVSVSESQVEATRKYIMNQENHHKTQSFADELELFMKKYGWEYIKV